MMDHIRTLYADLAAGGVMLGLAVSYPSPGMIERIAADWDWIWIDAQHGELGYQDVLALVRACDLVKRPAMLRVAGHEFSEIGRALDTGAAGVIVPCVDTAEQARAIARAAKFPPLGNRSYGGRRVVDVTGRAYSDTANADTMLIVQIESPQGLANADAIAATPGVDALFLGPDDMLLRRGVAMDVPRTPEMLRQVMQTVIDACRRHGKRGVMVGVGAAMLDACVAMGFTMVVSGADAMFLTNGSKAASTEARARIAGRGAPKHTHEHG
ncbi:MAG TPA: aldolase/citrate lyase family protein [Tepidisphaeraceae bacterium]|nr:aldolase/citrate lyase family protein [Tepidisphaeraceae bacterium]